MTETQTEPTTAGALLDELRQVMDATDELNKQLKPLNERKGEIHGALIRIAQEQGTDRFGNEKLSVTITEKSTARVDPEYWDALYQWAVATKNTQILYRQASATKLQELALDGVPLPDGVTLESIMAVNARRK